MNLPQKDETFIVYLILPAFQCGFMQISLFQKCYLTLETKLKNSSIKTNSKRRILLISMLQKQGQSSAFGLKHPSFTRNDHGFLQANWQVAQKVKYRQINRYHDNEEVPYSVNLQFFQQYGPGTYLFFEFTRRLIIVFCIMTILSIPAFVSNYLGGGLSKTAAGTTKTFFMQFSISNQPLDTTAQKTTLHNYLVVISDLLYSLVFFVFLLHWGTVSQRLSKKICEQAQLPSYFTVQVSGHKDFHTMPVIENFMSKFGDVYEIAEVKNYDESIKISMQIHQTTMSLKQEQLDDNPRDQEIEKLQVKLYQLYRKLTRQLAQQKMAVIKYFVTFKTVIDRKAVVQKFQRYNKGCLCGKKIEQEVLLDGVVPKVKPCFIQPGSIIWENMHISEFSRYVRWAIQLILLIGAVFLGFLVLSLLNIVTPTSTTLIDASNETYDTVIAKNTIDITKAWCLMQNPTSILTNENLLAMCQTYLLAYYSQISISVAIALSIIVIKSLLNIFITYLAKFQRYDSFNQQVSSLIVNLFLTYTFTTFVITFLLQAKILGISFKFIISRFVTDPALLNNMALLVEYQDLSRAWYLDIGYKVTMNLLTVMFLPHIIQPFLLALAECISNWRAKKEKFQRNMDKMIEGSLFQFEDNYANILMIVFVTLMLCGPIPLLLFFGTIALGLRYLFWKYYFIRFCKIPPTFDESLNDKVLRILPWSVFIHLAISIYAYGNEQIFPLMPNNISYLDQMTQQLSNGTSIFGILLMKRISCTWLLSGLLVILVVIYFLKAGFIDLIRSLVSMCKGQKVKVPTVIISNSKEFCPNTDKDFITSYRLENNREYESIIGILKSFSKKI